MPRPFSTRRTRGLFRRVALALPLLILAGVTSVPSVHAWKPYTHTVIGNRVWSDVTDDGMITITVGGNTHRYPVDGRIVNALRQWPSYYNAGVIGPDAFPDITYGQAVIHPEHTGQWLRYIYDSAWQAQNDLTYSSNQKGQILAFAYGFLIHGAGDMWGHTLVNGFAGAVFPSVTNMVSDLVQKGDPTRLLVGLRHIIAEGYAGNATPGWDSTEGDDIPDPTAPCTNGVNLNPPDALCSTASETTREELSQVCDSAMMANPPTGTTCEVTAQFNQLVPDVSANSTLGIPLNVPTRFVYNALIDPNAPTPLSSCGNGGTAPGCPNGTYLLSSDVSSIDSYSIQRGPALNFFLDLEAKLQVKSAEENDRASNSCLVNVPDTDCHHDTVNLTVTTVRGTGTFAIGRWICTKACITDPTITVPAALVRDYVNAWISDVQDGLQNWPDFSLAIARGLFDPQTRRDAENDACKTTGAEDVFNILRDKCENGVSLGDAVFFAADHFYATGDPSWINRFLIPMVGFPDFVGDLRQLGSEITSAIDDVFQFLGIFNPLSAILADLHEFVVSTVENYIKDSYGVDIPTFEEFFKHPTQWFCGDDGTGKSLTLFNYTVTPSGLFTQADHERMDGYMGFTDQSHHSEGAGLSTECSALNDSSKFDEAKFAAFADSVTMSKLLMLDGKQLDSVIGDALVDSGVIRSAGAVATYFQGVNYDSSTNNGTFPANVMVDTLAADGRATSAPTGSDLWLQLIDGDHAWRADGLPRFCNTTVAGRCSIPLPPEMQAYSLQPTPRVINDASLSDMTNAGGNGHFPLWASCLLRPGFRLLFKDWENADNATVTNFPDLGDPAVSDASISSPAQSTVTFSGTSYTAGGVTYIATDNTFTLGASDPVFEPAYLQIVYRTYKDGTTAPGYTPSTAPFLTAGATFNISPSAGDGLWDVNSLASNPCRPFSTSTASSASYFLDTTPPDINITQPAATTYTHSQVLTLAYTVGDGNGSGVNSFTPTLDGSSTLAGHGLQSGQAINLLTELSLGPHTFTIAATDNVNNSDTKSVTFTIIVTPQSIQDDVNQFFAAGMIKNAGLTNSLLAKLKAAAARRAAGDCNQAANIYGAFINELMAQMWTGVSISAAITMIQDAQYLIANCP